MTYLVNNIAKLGVTITKLGQDSQTGHLDDIVVEGGLMGCRAGARSQSRLVVIKRDSRAAGCVGKYTIIVVINGNGEGRGSKPATPVVTNKAVAITVPTLDADQK